MYLHLQSKYHQQIHKYIKHMKIHAVRKIQTARNLPSFSHGFNISCHCGHLWSKPTLRLQSDTKYHTKKNNKYNIHKTKEFCQTFESTLTVMNSVQLSHNSTNTWSVHLYFQLCFRYTTNILLWSVKNTNDTGCPKKNCA